MGRRIPELDGLRGLAILMVVLWHLVIYPLADGASISTLILMVLPITRLTFSGVDLFFVLSGFLVGGVLLDNRGLPDYFRTFYLRRACRILPAYLLWIALFVLAAALAKAVWSGEAADNLFGDRLPLLSYATFTQNFAMLSASTFGAAWLGVTWSLAVEEQFYFLLPLLIAVLPRKRLVPIAVALCTMAPMFRMVYPNILLVTRLDALMAGVIGAYLFRHPSAMSYLSDHPAILRLTAFGGGIGAVLTFTLRPSDGAVLGYSFLALFYLALLLTVVQGGSSKLATFTRARWLRGLGLISYGTYLYHQGINGLLHGLLLGQVPDMGGRADVLVTALAATLTVFVARLSWLYLESPFVALGHRVR